jgi:hypothetical protein
MIPGFYKRRRNHIGEDDVAEVLEVDWTLKWVEKVADPCDNRGYCWDTKNTKYLCEDGTNWRKDKFHLTTFKSLEEAESLCKLLRATTDYNVYIGVMRHEKVRSKDGPTYCRMFEEH